MNTLLTRTEDKILLPKDRCDSCGAQAYVCVTGMSGELMFCGHHYNKIMLSPTGKAKMKAFALEIIDERNFAIENRVKENVNI